MEDNTMPGGYLVGNSHSDGGIKIKTPEGQIEAEGGEVIINKRVLAKDEKFVCEGTPKEITSKINEMEGGVSWSETGSCKLVRKAEDGTEIEEEGNISDDGFGLLYTKNNKKFIVTADTKDQIELIDMAIKDYKDGLIDKENLENTLQSYMNDEEEFTGHIVYNNGKPFVYNDFYRGYIELYDEMPIDATSSEIEFALGGGIDKAALGYDFGEKESSEMDLLPKELVKQKINELENQFQAIRLEFRNNSLTQEEYFSEKQDLINKYNDYIDAAKRQDIAINQSLFLGIIKKKEKEQAARGTILRSSNPEKRPSPSVSATIYPEGYEMEGNDGNTWVISIDSRGVHRWKRLKAEDGVELEGGEQHSIEQPKEKIATSETELFTFNDSDTKGVESYYRFKEDIDRADDIYFDFTYDFYKGGKYFCSAQVIINDFEVDVEDFHVDKWDYARESHYTEAEGYSTTYSPGGFYVEETVDADGKYLELSANDMKNLKAEIGAIFKEKIMYYSTEGLANFQLKYGELLDVLKKHNIQKAADGMKTCGCGCGVAEDGKDLSSCGCSHSKYKDGGYVLKGVEVEDIAWLMKIAEEDDAALEFNYNETIVYFDMNELSEINRKKAKSIFTKKMKDGGGVDWEKRDNLEKFLSYTNDDIYWKWVNNELTDSEAIAMIEEIDGVKFIPNKEYNNGGGVAARGKVIVTKIEYIPNLQQELKAGRVTYRGLGLGKLYDDFYEIANESGTRIKVEGKEYYITDTDFRKLNWDEKNKKWKNLIRFSAPQRREDGGGIESSELKKNYDNLSSALEKQKVPSKIKLTDRDIIVELGWNYPDRLADKVFDAAESLGININTINVCAESSGDTVLESKRTSGGVRRYDDGGKVGNVKIEIKPQYYDEKDNRKNVELKYDVNYLITFDNKDFIELTGTLKPYHTGRDYEYEFEVDYFADQEEENFYEENSEKIEKEILDKFYSTTFAKGGGVGEIKFEELVGNKFSIKRGSGTKTTTWEKEDLLEEIKKVIEHELFDRNFYYNWTDEGAEYYNIFEKYTLTPMLKDIDKTLNEYFVMEKTSYNNILEFKEHSKIQSIKELGQGYIDNWFKTNPHISPMLRNDYKKYREKYAGITPYAKGGGVEQAEKGKELWFTPSGKLSAEKEGTARKMIEMRLAQMFGATSMSLVGEDEKHFIYELDGNSRKIEMVTAKLQEDKGLDVETYGRKKRVHIPKTAILQSSAYVRFPLLTPFKDGGKLEMLNDVPKGYLYLSNITNTSRKPNGKLTDVYKTNLSHLPATQIEQVNLYLESLNIDYTMKDDVPNYNPNFNEDDIPSTENYVIGLQVSPEKVRYFFVDTQGYDYPRYVTELINYNADGTNTTFDSNNPDIRYKNGGGLSNLNIDGYIFDLDKDNSIENEKVFKINDDKGNSIGKIYIVDKNGAYHIENVRLNKERTGVGYDIYKKLIGILDKPIKSGEVQNEKAKGLWDKLVKEGLAKKEGNGYVSNNPDIRPEYYDNGGKITNSELETINGYERKSKEDYDNNLKIAKGDDEMISMYRRDFSDHVFVSTLMRDGKWEMALETWRDMDTAARENISNDAYELLMGKNNLPTYRDGGGLSTKITPKSVGIYGTDGVLKFDDGSTINWNKKNYVIFNYESEYLENEEDWLFSTHPGIIVSSNPITIDEALKKRVELNIKSIIGSYSDPYPNYESRLGDVYFSDESVVKFMEVPRNRNIEPINKKDWFLFFDLDTYSVKFYSYGYKYNNTYITIKDKTFLENTPYKLSNSKILTERYSYYDIRLSVELTFTGLVSYDKITSISLSVFKTFDEFIDWCKNLPKGDNISLKIYYNIEYREYSNRRPQTDRGIVDVENKKLIPAKKLADGGGVESSKDKVWQIKKGNKYYSIGLQDGQIKWNESPDLGYSYDYESAEKLSNYLREEHPEIEIVKYDKDWWKKEDGGSIAEKFSELKSALDNAKQSRYFQESDDKYLYLQNVADPIINSADRKQWNALEDYSHRYSLNQGETVDAKEIKEKHIKIEEESNKMKDGGEMGMENEYAKGGEIVKYYSSEDEHRLSRPSSDIEKELLEKVNYHDYLKPLFIGNFGWKTPQGKLADGYLFELDEYDMGLIGTLKPNEKVFRYINRMTAISGSKPLIKINLEKGLLYFLTQNEDYNNDDIVFETRGVKASWIRLMDEKAADGKTIEGADYLTNAMLSILDLHAYVSANDNKIRIFGSEYTYMSHSKYNLRVTGGKGAVYNIIPYFPTSTVEKLQQAHFYTLVRQGRSYNFAITKQNEVIDLAEDGIQILTIS
jgi:hypothetical protein